MAQLALVNGGGSYLLVAPVVQIRPSLTYPGGAMTSRPRIFPAERWQSAIFIRSEEPL